MDTPSLAIPGLDERDAAQLRLLSIFHYVLAGVTALFSLIPVIHVVMGLAIATGKLPMEGADPAQPIDPRLFGWLFVAIGATLITLGMTLAALLLAAGRCLARRRRHTLCMVVAALSCLMMPLGTVLGVFTLVMLTRPEVRAAFQPAPARA